jgi:hypothetical protein
MCEKIDNCPHQYENRIKTFELLRIISSKNRKQTEMNGSIQKKSFGKKTEARFFIKPKTILIHIY